MPVCVAWGICEMVAGTGSEGEGANELRYPATAVLDGGGHYIVSDCGNHRIQKCPSSSPGSCCTTLFGTGGRGSALNQIDNPEYLLIDESGDYVVADSANTRVLLCPTTNPLGDCTVVVSDGYLAWPIGIALDGDGDYLVSDWYLGPEVSSFATRRCV